MGILYNCPLGATVPDIVIVDCPESVGQIQKAVFQRIYSSAGVLNKTAAPAVKASWTPWLAAADGTKAVQTPYLQAPTTEPGAARMFGGGNETLGGVEMVIGREPTSFTANMLNVSQATVASMKAFQGETVGVWLCDEFGRIVCLADDVVNPTEFYPIPIHALFIGDKGFGGLEAPDKNAVSWKFMPNWSDKLVIVTPTDFNSLTDLGSPVVES